MNLYSQRGKVGIVCINNSDMIHSGKMSYFSSFLIQFYLLLWQWAPCLGITWIIQFEYLHQKCAHLDFSCFFYILHMHSISSEMDFWLDTTLFIVVNGLKCHLFEGVLTLLFLYFLSHNEFSDHI